MPRLSVRQCSLAALEDDFRWLQDDREMKLLGDDDVFDDFDLIFEEELKERYNHLCTERFLARAASYRCGNSWRIFQEDLLQSSNQNCWLNDSEFKLKYCMLRNSFWKLHELIKGHSVFQVKGAKRQQMPSEYQVMVLLAFLRTEGDGMSDKKARSIFRLSTGAARDCKDRVVKAIGELLYQKTVFWPDEEERREISRRFQAEYRLPNLVGVADGTLFPLAFRPTRPDASDFHGRKHLYSLSTLLVNDDKKRIRYFNAGWAGCTHDERILANSVLNRKSNEMFCPMQYIIGDCAFAARWWVVPCYKKSPGSVLSRDKEIFNTTLSRPRVLSEHVNGLLKNRFPFLRSLRFRLTSQKKTMKRVLAYITVSIILHNLLIGFGDEGSVGEDEVSDVDMDNEINRALPIVDGGRRRDQLKNYIMENYHV
jgi:hypothetical protein